MTRKIANDLGAYCSCIRQFAVKNYDEADVKLARRVRKVEARIGLTP